MGETVLVATRYTAEAQAVVAALAQRYAARALSEAEDLKSSADTAVALVLDTNFTESMGLDVLMDVLGRTQITVLMITPADDPACAVEALRCGASGYLVKSGAYIDLLPMALQDALQRANATRTLKMEVAEQRKRITQLEAQVTATARGRTTAGSAPAAAVLSLEEEVAARLSSGNLQLPSYPRVAIKLRALLKSDVGVAEIARLLSQDAAVSAKLLRVANAAQYAHARKAESIESAVARIGLVATCNVAEMIANRSLYTSRNPAYRGFLDELWRHSVAVAYACEAIARRVEKAVTPKLFSLGLLHDAGKLALLQAVSQLDADGKRIASESDIQLFRAFLRKQNAQCGVMLMKRWNFDDDYQNVVRHHENVRNAHSLSRPVLIVSLADILVRTRGYGDALDSPQALEQSPARAFLLPQSDELEAIGREVDDAVEASQKLLA